MVAVPTCPVCGLTPVELMPSGRVVGHYQAVMTRRGLRRNDTRCPGRGTKPQYDDAQPEPALTPTFTAPRKAR